MTLEEILAQDDPALMTQLSSDELTRLFWKWKGLKKQYARDTDFYVATNENLKLAYEKLDEQERELSRAYSIIQEDLGVAKQVQTALLPELADDFANQLELAVFHKQLTEVGGDYYDFFRMAEGRYAIGLFDISGHGVSAALIMAFLKAQFMQVMETQRSLREIVDHVNHASFDFLREVRRLRRSTWLHLIQTKSAMSRVEATDTCCTRTDRVICSQGVALFGTAQKAL